MPKHQSKPGFSGRIQAEQWRSCPPSHHGPDHVIYNRLYAYMEEAFIFVSIFYNNSKKLIDWSPLVTPLIQKLLLFQITVKRGEFVHSEWFQGCLAYLHTLKDAPVRDNNLPSGFVAYREWLHSTGLPFTTDLSTPRLCCTREQTQLWWTRTSKQLCTGQYRWVPVGCLLNWGSYCGVLNTPKEIVWAVEQGNWMLRMPTKPQYFSSGYGWRI